MRIFSELSFFRTLFAAILGTQREWLNYMRVSLPFGVFRHFWARWKPPIELFYLV